MCNKILGRLGDIVPVGRIELVLALHYLCKQIVVVSVLVVEGRIAAEQNVGNHANRPDVHRFAITKCVCHNENSNQVGDGAGAEMFMVQVLGVSCGARVRATSLPAMFNCSLMPPTHRHTRIVSFAALKIREGLRASV